MLTSEQIQGFEARAKAGEKPRHPGWKFDEYTSSFYLWPTAFIITSSSDTDGVELLEMHEYENKPPLGLFDSEIAAQLAAEALLMEAVEPMLEALRDAARVAWCLSVGVSQRDARIGRREGSRTWMINVGNDPSDPGFGPWRFCHLAASDDEGCEHRMTMPGDYDCNLGRHFDINGAPDPERVRAIIDAAMAEANATGRDSNG